MVVAGEGKTTAYRVPVHDSSLHTLGDFDVSHAHTDTWTTTPGSGRAKVFGWTEITLTASMA